MLRFFSKPGSAAAAGAERSSGAPFWQRLLPALSRRAIAGNALEHLGSLPLTAQSSLALVRLHGETLLLGVTPQNITLLAKGGEIPLAGPLAAEPGELASR